LTPQGSHILIFLEEALLPKGLSLEQIKVYFQLTEREQAVVQSLCKGLTNKEIAVELGIAEQTVKEHVKNIMAKTGVTTRTGILAIALRAFSGSFSNGSQSFKQIGKTCPGDQENGQKRAPEDLNQERKDGADSNVTTTA
jgi:DNA-binding CsgD family transcriptional regulator